VISGELVYQGANIGVEGRIGNSINPVTGACVAHLHWDFSGFIPAKIDGVDPGTLAVGSRPTSTNVIIGDQFIDPSAGFEIDAEYYEWGQWTNIGWVSDAGRGLPMHRHGAGWEQNFASHDDETGIRRSGIYVPDRVQDDAFWVQPEFWNLYQSTYGGATGFLQYPTGEEVLPCPQSAPFPCESFQPFECGFIWDDGSAIFAAHTCAGLYAISGSGGENRRLGQFTAGWDLEDEDDPSSTAQNLKSYGELMVHKEGTGQGQTFFVSQDGGETWTATAKPADTACRPIDADFCPGSPPKLWTAWQSSNPTQYNRISLYYSEDYGATITLSSDVSIGGFNGYAAQFNGGLSCNDSDPNRIAAVVQRGSSARVRVTTNGGASWSTYGAGSLANAYRIAWSGDRLVLVYDGGSTFRVLVSDNDGASWTNTGSFSNDSAGTTNVDVIRTTVSGLVFAFFDPRSPDHVLRSTDNGSTWQQVGALPSGLGSSAGIRGLAYDGVEDLLFAAWTIDKVVVLRNASTVNWPSVEASDWITLPVLGGVHIRSLALDGSGGSVGLLGP
jgi:hypothetical protein